MMMMIIIIEDNECEHNVTQIHPITKFVKTPSPVGLEPTTSEYLLPH